MDSEKIKDQINRLKHKRVVLDGKIARLESSLEKGITNVKKQSVKKEQKIEQKETKSEQKEKESSFFGF